MSRWAAAQGTPDAILAAALEQAKAGEMAAVLPAEIVERNAEIDAAAQWYADVAPASVSFENTVAADAKTAIDTVAPAAAQAMDALVRDEVAFNSALVPQIRQLDATEIQDELTDVSVIVAAGRTADDTEADDALQAFQTEVPEIQRFVDAMDDDAEAEVAADAGAYVAYVSAIANAIRGVAGSNANNAAGFQPNAEQVPGGQPGPPPAGPRGGEAEEILGALDGRMLVPGSIPTANFPKATQTAMLPIGAAIVSLGEAIVMAMPGPGGGATVTLKPVSGSTARRASTHINELVRKAQQQYPNLKGTQLHHVVPQYLGGAKNGTTVRIDAAYHQQITNEFRRLWPYGTGSKPNPQQLQSMLREVYKKFPLYNN